MFHSDKAAFPDTKGRRPFDLNIDKILENWTPVHACRELIANALDEAVLTGSQTPVIQKTGQYSWIIRDYGRGLNYQSLIQTENKEKMSNSHMIGKFGIGLKDALATFERQGISVILRSRHGDIGLERVAKHSFDDVITLHAVLYPPSNPTMIGTKCELLGISDDDVFAAQEMFLEFSDAELAERTKFGEIYSRHGDEGEIFINGMKVASEPNFLFSYNITGVTSQLRKALNRERQNLGRTAYADRVKAILLACSSDGVTSMLSADLEALTTGNAHEELSWIEIQNFAVRILNAKKNVVFVSAHELANNPNITYVAESMGHQIVPVSDNLARRIKNSYDILGRPVMDTNELYQQHSDSFEFTWVEPKALSEKELEIWNLHEQILGFMGGRPASVKEIRISETMKQDVCNGNECDGLWMPSEGWIVIKRSQLLPLERFAAILLHEAVHAKYGVVDLSQGFEWRLTELSGILAAQLIHAEHHYSTKRSIPRSEEKLQDKKVDTLLAKILQFLSKKRGK
jgi:hypothetical protein